MSLQWALIAGFLYFEIAIVLLLVLPIFSAKRWNRIFKSNFLQALGRQAGMYFVILLGVLVLFLLDAIREMKKYSNPDHTGHDHNILNMGLQDNMRLFRAQRNFYISGFALFLSFVIRRLVTLISSQAHLLAQSEAAMKQATSASNAARNLMAHRGEEDQNIKNEVHDSEVKVLKETIAELEKQLDKEKKDKEVMKTQSENLHKEYDRLSEEHSKLQKTVTSGGDKKDE